MVEQEYRLIGKIIREFRKKRQFTQDQLAERTGFSVSHIRNIESGNTKIGLDAVVKIANELDASTDILLQGSLKNKRKVLDYMLLSKFEKYGDRTIKALVEIAEIMDENLQNK